MTDPKAQLKYAVEFEKHFPPPLNCEYIPSTDSYSVAAAGWWADEILVRNHNKLYDGWKAARHYAYKCDELRTALRNFTENSSIQTNYPAECEFAEAALDKAGGES